MSDAPLLLVVEDDQSILETIEQLLVEEGYRTATARDGQQALDWLAQTHEAPDLILLDLMMPVIDGYAFRRLQLADWRIASIPVVIMTAGAPSQGELRAQGVLQKPFDIDTFLDMVKRHAPHREAVIGGSDAAAKKASSEKS
jgi:CheY-like chemotaxis protein